MIEVRTAELADVDAVRRIGLTTWPVAYAGLASDEFITDGLAQWWWSEGSAPGSPSSPPKMTPKVTSSSAWSASAARATSG